MRCPGEAGACPGQRGRGAAWRWDPSTAVGWGKRVRSQDNPWISRLNPWRPWCLEDRVAGDHSAQRSGHVGTEKGRNGKRFCGCWVSQRLPVGRNLPGPAWASCSLPFSAKPLQGFRPPTPGSGGGGWFVVQALVTSQLPCCYTSPGSSWQPRASL